MTINRGSTLITDIRRGSTLINEVRRGSIIVWTRSVKRDDFERADADTLESNWTDYGPSNDRFIGVENEFARLIIPEGLLGGFWSLRTSRQRFNLATAPADDGFVECRLGSRGDGASATSLVGYTTQLFGRVSNTAFTHGVGIEMAAGHCWIVRRASGTDTRMADGGTFQAGDRLRLTYVTNLHTLYKNGLQVAQWNDSGATASRGSGFRSMGMRADGAKDLLGPRRYSPSLDYVLMG